MLVVVTVFQVCFKRCNCKMSTNRGALWFDGEVRALIAVWGESNVQEELDGAVRNKVIFVAISDELLQQGYNRDWQQCRTKIKNQKRNTVVKDHNGETGRGRKTCKFFSELDTILGHRPASTPSVLLDTGMSSLSQGDSQDEEREINGNSQDCCVT